MHILEILKSRRESLAATAARAVYRAATAAAARMPRSTVPRRGRGRATSILLRTQLAGTAAQPMMESLAQPATRRRALHLPTLSLPTSLHPQIARAERAEARRPPTERPVVVQPSTSMAPASELSLYTHWQR